MAVWQLQDNAYCIPMRSQIEEMTREKVSLGSIYIPLDRLLKREYFDSYLSTATPERGGRHKRIYKLTKEGMRALRK